MTGGTWSQPVQMSLSDTSLQLTKVSPTVATAPNSTGTATQMSWVMVNTQEPFVVRAYDKKGTMLTVTDAKGNTTEKQYDARGNLIKSIDAAGHATSYT